jgi:hypothetical protein
MKSLSILPLAFVAVAALLGSCGGGGEEEVATLAVAFRLDEGSPVMVAYIGDPAEDPFQLPAGRYYIEALDQDDVLLSLGTVDIEDGDAVDFPSSFEAAGGVEDPEEAAPLITLASFLIDLELAKYESLEIVTGGFSESPFDPSVELDEADFQGLAAMYEEIAAQEDSVLGALDKIEGRAEVSLRIPYVRFPWAPAEDMKEVRQAILGYFIMIISETPRFKEAGYAVPESIGDVMIKTAEEFGAQVHEERKTPLNSEGLLDKKRKWEEYAKTVGADLPGLQKKISSDLKQLFPGLTSEQLDDWTKAYVNEIAEAVPELAKTTPALAATPTPTPAPTPSPTPTPETTPTPAADIGWIEGYVAEMSEAWLDMGLSGIDVAVYADDLRQCLIQAMQAGATREEAEADLCPFWLFQPIPTPEAQETPTAEPEETPPPEPTETPTAEPEETPTPEATPSPTATPTPEGQQVTAKGSFTHLKPPLSERWKRTENSVTLNFNTAGGLVTGNGRTVLHDFEYDCDFWEQYDFRGEYSAATGQFNGTWESSWNDECSTFGLVESTGTWEATLAGGTIVGTAKFEGTEYATFELTVQG